MSPAKFWKWQHAHTGDYNQNLSMKNHENTLAREIVMIFRMSNHVTSLSSAD
jgi:hypothetical protein